MPSIKWQHVWSSPLTTSKIILFSLVRSVGAISNVLFSPNQPLSFRTAIVRIWIGTSFGFNSEIWYSEPASHDVQTINTNGTTIYVIPTTTPEELANADAVYIYAHGGGMAIGHPLQYLDEYKRWVKLAKKKGKRLVILAPIYPLSPQRKLPAQRDALEALYTWVLSKSINATRIIMGGDSAGSDLALLFLLHLRSHSPATPLPAALVLHSPSIDMTAAETQYTPRIKWDFMFEYSKIVPFNNDMIRPKDLPFDTPEISALLWKDVSGLPPQLIYWSSTEVLASDSERWVERCREAGVQVTEFKRSGQLHTFSLGWPFTGRRLQNECDALLIDFIFKYV